MWGGSPDQGKSMLQIRFVSIYAFEIANVGGSGRYGENDYDHDNDMIVVLQTVGQSLAHCVLILINLERPKSLAGVSPFLSSSFSASSFSASPSSSSSHSPHSNILLHLPFLSPAPNFVLIFGLIFTQLCSI